MNTILDGLDEIDETLQSDPGALNPIMWAGADGDIVVEDWAAGFLEAVSLHADDWRPLFEDDDAFLAILPLLIAEQDAEGLQKMNIAEAVQRETLQQLPELLPSCIENMRESLAQHVGPAGNDNVPPTRH